MDMLYGRYKHGWAAVDGIAYVFGGLITSVDPDVY